MLLSNSKESPAFRRGESQNRTFLQTILATATASQWGKHLLPYADSISSPVISIVKRFTFTKPGRVTKPSLCSLPSLMVALEQLHALLDCSLFFPCVDPLGQSPCLPAPPGQTNAELMQAQNSRWGKKESRPCG